MNLIISRLSVNPDSVKSVDRERAKRVVYSVVYGVGMLILKDLKLSSIINNFKPFSFQGKERLADTLNVSAEEAKSFTTSFLGTIRPIHILCQLKL